MPSNEELVRLSGVSRSTVFRFLRGQNVRPQARSAILAAMEQLNIQHEDHSVHHGSSLLISIRPDFRVFKGFDLSINGFIEKAEHYGFRVELKTGSAIEAVEAARGKAQIAGVLFLGKTMREEEAESERLRSAGIPHVFVNRMFDDLRFSWISVDHRLAAEEAVDHLVDLGHTDIGTWGVPHTYRIDKDKRTGYLRALEKSGLRVPVSCLDMETHGDLEPAVQALIESHKMPTAWFAPSDEHAMRLIKLARENEIRVPEDVAVVGMDDVGPAEYLTPPLTTVHIPFREAGSAAFDALRHLIENPSESSVRFLMKHRLIIRESSGASRIVPIPEREPHS